MLRSTRAIAGCIFSELLEIYQGKQQVASLLRTALRRQGCRFLGPVLQEETLRIILKEMGGGAFLSRMNIVQSVVQQLQDEFPQVSKKGVGQVVQLLHRAACFNVSLEMVLLMIPACTEICKKIKICFNC